VFHKIKGKTLTRLRCIFPLIFEPTAAATLRHRRPTIGVRVLFGIRGAPYQPAAKDGLISESFSLWLQSLKRYQIPSLSTIRLKRRCIGEEFGTPFWRLEPKSEKLSEMYQPLYWLPFKVKVCTAMLCAANNSGKESSHNVDKVLQK
jgi:hypothetical protein